MLILSKESKGLVKWWVGTDALVQVAYPPGSRIWHIRIFFERLFWRVFGRFFRHWVNSEKLIEYIEHYSDDIQVMPFPSVYKIYPKRKHSTFNVLVYLPKKKRNQKYKDWIYGRKIIQGVMDELRGLDDIHFIVADGTLDMSEVYPITDLYIKIMRHRGSDKNRIAKECEHNGIKVIYTNYADTNNANIIMITKVIKELAYGRLSK